MVAFLTRTERQEIIQWTILANVPACALALSNLNCRHEYSENLIRLSLIILN